MQFLTPFEGGPLHGQRTIKCEDTLPAAGGCYRLVLTEKLKLPLRYEFHAGVFAPSNPPAPPLNQGDGTSVAEFILYEGQRADVHPSSH